MNRLCILVAMGLLATRLPAQGLTTLNGTVLNEGGRPLEYVQVSLDPAGMNRQVRTDRDGRFNFPGVSPGAHVLRVTWVGYAPDERTIEATGGVQAVEVTLRRLTTLGAVEVTARRSGLHGVVLSRDSLKPVPGARIEVIGARKSDSTGAEGVFNMPDIRPGSYLVRVRHPLFESRNVPVVVPVNGAAELDVVVSRGSLSRDQHMEMLYREMDSRLAFKGEHAAMVTREELRGREKSPLDMAIQMVPRMSQKQFLFVPDACVFVDGVPRPGAMITDFAPEDVEAVEIYGAPYEEKTRNPARALSKADQTGSLESRWPRAMPCGQPSVPTGGGGAIPRSRIVSMFVLIWLKK